MSSPPAPTRDRAAQVEYVSRELLRRTGLLTRLLIRELRTELSRSQASVLSTLSGGPRRITELAELEGLAQPTMTLLVKQLEQQGLVIRERQADDGRVVLVDITDAGRTEFQAFAADVSAALGVYLADTSDEQVKALAAATETLGALVSALQQPRPSL
jgi:DNA-binding MarR family transcriptional regulator